MFNRFNEKRGRYESTSKSRFGKKQIASKLKDILKNLDSTGEHILCSPAAITVKKDEAVKVALDSRTKKQLPIKATTNATWKIS